MEKSLKVALIQTTTDYNLAWSEFASYKPRMDMAEAQRAHDEASRIIAEYDSLDESRKPDIILLPELAIAKCFQPRLKHWAKQLGCIVIAGHDFEVMPDGKAVNRASIVIPYQWPHGKGETKGKTFLIGKRFPAAEERSYIKNCGFEFDSCERFYLLDAEDYGRIGLAICADFYDIERFTLYKGRVQHLFIIAYNKDIKSFNFLAEAISRLVYCNVVICNTGFYGGSLGFSLYKNEYKRYIYRHEGSGLFTSQIVELPVDSLYQAQKNGDCNNKPTDEDEFKSPPPSYNWKY